jgi:hypothetical protein
VALGAAVLWQGGSWRWNSESSARNAP